jgi:hypothetical protein
VKDAVGEEKWFVTHIQRFRIINGSNTYHNQNINFVFSSLGSQGSGESSEEDLGGSWKKGKITNALTHFGNTLANAQENLQYKALIGLGMKPALLDVKVIRPL